MKGYIVYGASPDYKMTLDEIHWKASRQQQQQKPAHYVELSGVGGYYCGLEELCAKTPGLSLLCFV